VRIILFKQHFIILACLTLFLSCSTSIKEHSLYDVYVSYSSKLKYNKNYTNQELENLFQHFSPRYQTEILNGRPASTKVIKHLITKYFSTPLELKIILSHYETHKSQQLFVD